MSISSDSSQFQILQQVRNKYHHSTFEQKNQTNFCDLVRSQLLEYKQISEQDFVIIDEEQEHVQQMINLSEIGVSNTYMHNHKTLVPIGANFQAVVPKLISEAAYKAKSIPLMRRIKSIKINDPKQGLQFRQNYDELICQKFGSQRTDEDFTLLRNCYRQYERYTFERYLDQNITFWTEYFKNRDKILNKLSRKKKRKNKGTIPT